LPVHEELQRLVELQACDDELWAREQEHAALPGRRTRSREARAVAEAAIVSGREAVQQAEARQRRVEAELQDQEALRRRLEGQQFQVKTNDAYTALLHEMERAQRAISDCETQLLEAMDAIETARSAHAAAEAGARQAFRELDAEEQALASREKELDAELTRLRGERGRIVAGTLPKLVEQYEKVATRRRPAVVLIREATCAACRVDIPPQTYIEIQRAARLITCGNCTRILLVSPPPPA
jgi:predicted  nucleic acid-binding Zn-ribbon protein